MFMNIESFYFSTLYKRFGIFKLCIGIFYIVKLIIQKFRGANPNSSKVKTYDYSPLYFGVMMRVKMYIVIFVSRYVMNFIF